MKKIISLVLVVIITSFLSLNVFAVSSNIKVYVDGTLQTHYQQPVYVGSTVFVPMDTFLALGARINSNRSNTSIDIFTSNISIATGVKNKTLTVSKISTGNDGSRAVLSTHTVTLDAAPTLINGIAMVPLRIISELLGAKVSWDNKLKAAMVTTGSTANETTGIIMPKISIDQEYINKIKNKLIVENDIRLFTLYAFMNFTGYDDENNKDGFSQLRKLVRDDLQKMNLQLSENDYYKARNVSYDKYTMALRQMGDAPEFQYMQTNNIPQGLSDLGTKLKEFYTKASIDDLYKKYMTYSDSEISKYQAGVSSDLAYTFKYLGIDIDQFSKIYIEINLLDAYERGSGLGMKDYVKGNVIMTGPSYNSPNKINIVHEFLHGIINPITDQCKESFLKEDYRMSDLSNTVAYKQGYTSWESIVTESFVRALSAMSVYRNDDMQLKNMISKDTQDGFVMTQYVFDRFSKEYSSYTGGLEAFVKDVITKYGK